MDDVQGRLHEMTEEALATLQVQLTDKDPRTRSYAAQTIVRVRCELDKAEDRRLWWEQSMESAKKSAELMDRHVEFMEKKIEAMEETIADRKERRKGGEEKDGSPEEDPRSLADAYRGTVSGPGLATGAIAGGLDP